MRISDWSSDVCSSDLDLPLAAEQQKHDGENHQPVPNAQATHRVLRNPVTPPSDAPDYTRPGPRIARSEEHTSELQSLMRISYAVFCLKKKQHKKTFQTPQALNDKQPLNHIHLQQTPI